MKILAIDTSNQTLSIAVTNGTTVLGELTTNIKKNHSTRAMPAIDELMKKVNVKPKELERIVVASGPGSYTGVRIGVTIAKTLAWTLQIPLVGVSSLQLIAQNASLFDGYICPIFDARRGLVYTGLYKAEQEFVSSVVEDCNILLKDWLDMLKEKDKPILFIGNDVAIHKELIIEQLEDKAIFAPFTLHNPRASELALIGASSEPVDLHTFAPSYLRLVEAEANWLASQKK
ncbi:tRNA (adenosine(37)-N6)-threonylcarbamoyltransferase complex dimerization subunit type 1 TsaB [Lottiidibacillus patelloidae]|uniref:tRNA (Adenosine(37)-N6)-threonylcarbamoyltransferase complex dimerization subunit type 1 TsaB n=1 Tax=Lottiidibacillus patelloidae TaxID=2670334 RepID=A0A263BPZ3_9BACI|nr:tRNA (adenosine(37)-N6)-threonylcarbamoyltransferase complex dimerization subunit type 1 TsaB [Lottiidibacillus patelloidae]OZM55813.1 tRNA (adenosine(37)-N6)-threonylcarbamoyltransferase complex dimerization subunit type 1 TsaB [Lottiidibacillus patelloidae]